MTTFPPNMTLHNRPMGTSEWFYWLYNKLSCTNFVIAVRSNTLIAPEYLHTKLGEIQARHPILRTGIFLKPGAVIPSFGLLEESSVSLEIIHDAQPVDAYILNQLEAKFEDNSSLPAWGCTLLQHSGQHASTLVFTFQHALFDGKSAAHLIEIILSHISGNMDISSMTAADRLPPQETLYPAKYRGVRGRLRLLWQVLVDMVTVLPRFRLKQLRDVASDDTTRSLDMHSIAFDRETTRRIVESCRTQNTTLNAAISAAQLLAVREQVSKDGTADLSLHNAINMRPYLETPLPDNQTGMGISMVQTYFHVDTDHDFWELARQTKQQLTQKTNKGAAHTLWTGFASPRYFPPNEKGLGRLKKLTEMTPPNTIITNLGTWESSGNRWSETWFAMGPSKHCPLISAVHTFNGRLQINSIFDKNLIRNDTVQRIAQSMQERLESL